MGEVNIPQNNEAKRPARKKLSTRVDLTPMVDLGFLLITFFIFTTTMNEPKSMKLALPKDTIDNPIKTIESKTLSLILGKNNQLWYYPGNSIDKIENTNYSDGIRRVISEKKKLIYSLFKADNELVVLIKPTMYSSYQNIVDILDEMTINGVTRHVLMDPSIIEVERVTAQ